MRRFSVIAAIAVGGALMVAPSAATAQTVVSCPFRGGAGGDNLSRGFYVTNYPGRNIDQVTLRYFTDTPGTYPITLIARAGTYDGPIIGSPTVDASLPINPFILVTPVTFSFGGVAVTRGSTITFTQSETGPGTLSYDVGVGPCPGVTQTTGTTPPLDSPRRDSVGLSITQVPPGAPGAGAPPPGTTLTCGGQRVTQVGTTDPDRITGTAAADVISTLGGNDTVSPLGANDVVCGGAGKDTLNGGNGKDSLLGQKGKDALKGGPGRDLCKGGKGNDTASKCEVEKSI
jgi:Ca2+-binding RTX toxin-like protein